MLLSSIIILYMNVQLLLVSLAASNSLSVIMFVQKWYTVIQFCKQISLLTFQYYISCKSLNNNGNQIF